MEPNERAVGAPNRGDEKPRLAGIENVPRGANVACGVRVVVLQEWVMDGAGVTARVELKDEPPMEVTGDRCPPLHQ